MGKEYERSKRKTAVGHGKKEKEGHSLKQRKVKGRDLTSNERKTKSSERQVSPFKEKLKDQKVLNL